MMIFVMVFFSRKRETVNPGHFLAIVGLTLVKRRGRGVLALSRPFSRHIRRILSS